MLAASDRGCHVEQEKLIALDKEEQSRWENEIVSSSPSKIEDNGKDEPAEPDSQVRVIATVGRSNNFCQIRAKISLLTLLRKRPNSDLAKNIFHQEQHFETAL